MTLPLIDSGVLARKCSVEMKEVLSIIHVNEGLSRAQTSQEYNRFATHSCSGEIANAKSHN